MGFLPSIPLPAPGLWTEEKMDRRNNDNDNGWTTAINHYCADPPVATCTGSERSHLPRQPVTIESWPVRRNRRISHWVDRETKGTASEWDQLILCDPPRRWRPGSYISCNHCIDHGLVSPINLAPERPWSFPDTVHAPSSDKYPGTHHLDDLAMQLRTPGYIGRFSISPPFAAPIPRLPLYLDQVADSPIDIDNLESLEAQLQTTSSSNWAAEGNLGAYLHANTSGLHDWSQHRLLHLGLTRQSIPLAPAINGKGMLFDNANAGREWHNAASHSRRSLAASPTGTDQSDIHGITQQSYFPHHAQKTSSAWRRASSARLLSSLAEVHELMRCSYDCVVVGSGYGGAVAASRIARSKDVSEKRPSVCVLDRGREKVPGEAPSTVLDSSDEVHVSSEAAQSWLRTPVDHSDPSGLYHLIFGKRLNPVGCNDLCGANLMNENVLQSPEFPVGSSELRLVDAVARGRDPRPAETEETKPDMAISEILHADQYWKWPLLAAASLHSRDQSWEDTCWRLPKVETVRETTSPAETWLSLDIFDHAAWATGSSGPFTPSYLVFQWVTSFYHFYRAVLTEQHRVMAQTQLGLPQPTELYRCTLVA